eukprot:TRINITY_DN3532_c0_g1_i2.p1 TRINITY_DN3532_c0_g1~~TRINITY_DN3532_c0_g1_i2.p1  ORF type:complete len:697 (-),score=219.70 TRINITY_DN3532_c0_g1_i2:73-2163(-)
MDRTQLEQLLLQRLEPNTERVKQANDIVTKFSKQPGALPMLFELMCSSAHWEARQLAALYIKKVVSKAWIRHDAATQEQFKAVLIQRVVLEEDRRVRGSIAEVASEIAKFLVPSNQWPALMQFLDESSRSNSPDHREVAMMLFERLIENVGDTLRAHFVQFAALFGSALNDPVSLAVRVAALKALGMLVQHLHTTEELQLASQHIPAMMEIILQCVQQLGGEEDSSGTLIASFELLDDLLESPGPVLAAHLPSVVEALLKIAGERGLDRSTRERAINFFYFAALRKPKMLTKAKLMGKILEVMFQVLCEAEDEDEDGTSTHELAGQAINMMCTHLPNKQIFPVLAQFVSQALPHQDPLVRKAAVSALMIAAEGCHAPMRQNLPSVVPQVVQCCSDPHLEVRESACICIGQFAEFLQPEINDHYTIVLPALFHMLEDGSTEVQEKACYALYNFCECLEEKIVPYLQELCSKLVLIVKGHPKRDVQEMAVAALASVMAAAGDAVKPYAEEVLQVLKILMQQTGDSELKLRARATECVGVLGVMLGKEVFSKVAEEYIQLALAGMQSSFPELREFTFGFFSNMGEIFQDEFAPMLETIVPLALASLTSEDHEEVADDAAVDLGSEDTDSEGEQGRPKRPAVRTDLLDEKAAAAQMLGSLADSVGPGFAPHLDACMEALEDASEYMRLSLIHISEPTRPY